MTPEAQSVPEVQPDWAEVHRPSRELSGWVGAGLLWLLLAAAAVLWWRRLAGAFSAPLEPVALLLASTSVAALVGVTRLAWRHQAAQRRPRRLAAIALSTVAVCLGAALWLPHTSSIGLVILWAVLALEECWAWGPGGIWRVGARRGPRRPASQEGPPAQATSAEPGAVLPSLRLEHRPEGEVTQQMTRVQSSEGSETLSGWLRVGMAAGQRSANVHVAFCPAFARAPRVSVEQRGGPSARIKTVQVLRQGVRFDLKLAAPGAEPQTVLLEFSAEAAQVAEAAGRDGQVSSDA